MSVLRVTQSDGHGRTFLLDSGAEWIGPKENTALERLAEGIKAQGAFPTKPVKLTSEDITLISNAARRATGIAGLRGQLESVLAGNIRFPGADYLLGPALAGVSREAQGVKIDEVKLAAAIAENITPVLTSALANVRLSDNDDIAEGVTAKSIAEELAHLLAAS